MDSGHTRSVDGEGDASQRLPRTQEATSLHVRSSAGELRQQAKPYLLQINRGDRRLNMMQSILPPSPKAKCATAGRETGRALFK
ncbi:hypothetical protein NDU88_007166 [Pleurodeles waltl]|uniref:Uncharacterized protein n=1 Tax=Pleurodeles waltl TaxID=8319 RepID=A0AAV7NSA7_PLEWA|nr:hypothetical protein NDU88_007166 [Pleurodeles waltl]